MNKYEEFNEEQIKPVLSDLHIGHSAIKGMLNTLDEYISLLEEIIAIIVRAGKITHPTIIKMDKNVAYILNELFISISKSVTLNNFGIGRQKIFDRLKSGVTYRYKLQNGCLAENPEVYDFDDITIDVNHRILTVSLQETQF